MSVQLSAVPMTLEVMSEKMRVGQQRLEHLDQGQQVRNKEKELENEVRHLTTMIESMHAKELERLGQAEHDKRTQKVSSRLICPFLPPTASSLNLDIENIG